MNTRLLYISEEHISEMASSEDAKCVVDLLVADGWLVSYGDKPWEFTNEDERKPFEQAFQWAVKVREAEKRPFDESTFTGLARQRIQRNSKLRPYEEELLDERPEWSGYLGWLIKSPAPVIVNWLEVVWTKKGTSNS